MGEEEYKFPNETHAKVFYKYITSAFFMSSFEHGNMQKIYY